MKSITNAAAVLALTGSAFASRVFDTAPGGLPKGWTELSTPKPEQPIKLRVSLMQQNLDRFEDMLYAVSTPQDPLYGEHMEGHEVRDMLRPTETTIKVVRDWLASYDIVNIQDDSDWYTFTTNVSNANALLDTNFLWYMSPDTGGARLRTLQYSVPDNVREHINLVQPTTRFGSMRRDASTVMKMQDLNPQSELARTGKVAADYIIPGQFGGVNASCNSTITPTCLAQLYNLHYGANATGGSKVAFASFLEEYARYADLAAWEPLYAPWATGQNFTTVKIAGGLDNQTSTADSGEANLDCQYIKGVSAPLPETQFSTAGRAPLVPDLDQPDPNDNQNEPYLDYLLAITRFNNSQLPQVISHSYGEDEQSVPESYVRQVCLLFGVLGARGVSIIFSSGDSGVGSACQTNDGKNTTVFQPQFPAACPTVTSVGGTQYVAPEQAVFFSSGGFSRLFPRPRYQDKAVKAYLSKIGNNFSQYFNRDGRGFPDVSAQAVRYVVSDKGVLKAYQGTSCSAPAFAGVVGLLNAARLSVGKKTFGFLNPWIYSIGASGFTDITVGKSTGCDGRARFNGPPNGSPVIPGASFNATKGWDPVTGLGTPNFGKLLFLSTPKVPNIGGPVPRA